MNIEQAKTIPLALVLEKIGCRPTKEKAYKSIYLSPIRIEKTASFHVNNIKNVWYDFGTGKGGDVIDFVCDYLQSCNESGTAADALRWLDNMTGYISPIKPTFTTDFSKGDPSLVLKHAKPLKHPALIKYLESRGIPLNIASSYLTEVFIHNKESSKDFFALGMLNEDGGYEIRNKFLKGSVGPKTISFIRGKQPKPNGIHIFEGIIDYVSAITFKNVTRFDDDTIILNSLSCLNFATPYIKNYGYGIAYTWLDNDLAGQKGTKALAEFFTTEKDLQHKPMNKIYHPHKDVNAWHMSRLSLAM